MFPRLKAQAPEISDEQAITQAIKELCTSHLHNHLVREHPRTLEELYDEFHKFSRAEVLHFRKLGQQRKSISENESSRPFKYSKGKEGTTSFDTPHRQVHSINTDECGPPKNWEKNFRPLRPESESGTYDPRGDRTQTRGGYANRGCGRGQMQGKPLYCMFQERDTDHRMRDCPIFLESKKKMTQKHSQPSTPVKEVNYTSHWHQPSQSSSSNQPSYQNFNPLPEYQSNYHIYPSQYYQPYNYTLHTSQVHTPQPTITYPPTPLQIMYPTASSQATQPKTEPNNPPPPLQQKPDSSQQASSFPTFRTIHTITGGSNLTFENKKQK
jgi:hypothetical protein